MFDQNIMICLKERAWNTLHGEYVAVFYQYGSLLGTRVHCDPNDTKIKKKIKKNYLKKGRGTFLSFTEAPLILYQKIGIYSGNQN